MPIYAYRCAACGHTKDVLQKLSDPVLSTCPACGKDSFAKQLTAAGFQLKGSGWYVTDFRGGSGAGAAAAAGGATGDAAAKAEPANAGTATASASGSASADSSGASSSAGGCGTSCACH